MNNLISLSNVQYKDLRKKALAYAELVGKRITDVGVQIQGVFKDLDSELVFLNHSWHNLDTSLLGHEDWIYVNFDGTWDKLVPLEHGEIEEIRMFEK